MMLLLRECEFETQKLHNGVYFVIGNWIGYYLSVSLRTTTMAEVALEARV